MRDRHEFRARPDGSEAYVRSLIDEQLPGRRRPGTGEVRGRLLRERRLQRGPVAPDPRGGGAVRAGAPAARRRARTVRRRGARRRDRRGIGRPPRRPVARPASTRWRPRPTTIDPVVATSCPATTWFLMKDHGAPARTFIDAASRSRSARTSTRARRRRASLPLAMTFACLELGMSPDEALVAVTINAARRSASTMRSGRSRPGKQADLVGLARPDVDDRSPTGPAPTSSGRSIKRGRVVLERAALSAAPASGLLAAGLEEDGRRLGRQARGRHRRASAASSVRRPSRGRTSQRLGAIGVVVAERHRHDDLRVELGDERRGLRRRQRAAERHAGDVHRADVAELLLRQRVADLAEVDRVDPVDLDDERDPLAGSAPWRRRDRSGPR